MTGKLLRAGVFGLGVSMAACGGESKPVYDSIPETIPTYVAPDISLEANTAERSLYFYAGGGDAEIARTDFQSTTERVGTYDPASRQKVTRVVLSFAGLSVNQDGASAPTVADTYIDKNAVKKTRELFPNASVGLAIGGWNEALTEPWQAALEHPSMFAADLAFTARELDIDAVALDFEFPKPEQREAYAKLVDITVRQLSAVDIEDVTVAIPAQAGAREGFDLLAMTASGARLEVMNYDMHGTWEQTIQHDSSNQDTVQSINDLLASGVLPQDLLLGYGMYGRRYQGVANPQNPLDQPVSQADKNTDNTVLNTAIAERTASDEWITIDLGEAGRFRANPATQELYTLFGPPDIARRNQVATERTIGRFAWGLQTMTSQDLDAFVS